MPSAAVILGDLTAIANEWRTLAIFWHVFTGTLLIAIGTRQNVSNRSACYLLVLPLISVSGLAWISGNPFNGAMFAALSLLLARFARRLPGGRVHLAPAGLIAPGFVLVAFGWVYPHFLETESWTTYLIAAPLGLLPCPTLSAVIGVTLILGLARSTAWALTLAIAGAVYSFIGMFTLGVPIDLGLAAGSVMLVVMTSGGERRRIDAWRPEIHDSHHTRPLSS